MKKQILVSAAAVALAVPAFAQHPGQGGVGVNIGVSPVIEGKGSPTHFLLGVKGQYSYTDLIRGTISLDFGLPDEKVNTFNALVNVNFMIPVSRPVYVYPLVGVGYGHVSNRFFGNGDDDIVFDVGIGGEYEFNRNFAAGLEFKYRYMNHYNALPVVFNLSYKF